MTKSTFQLSLRRNCRAEDRAHLNVTWTFDSNAERREIYLRLCQVLDKYLAHAARVFGCEEDEYDPCAITLSCTDVSALQQTVCVWNPSLSEGGLLVLIARLDTLFQDISSWSRARDGGVRPKAVVEHVYR